MEAGEQLRQPRDGMAVASSMPVAAGSEKGSEIHTHEELTEPAGMG